MNMELEALELKIEQVLELVQQTRAENEVLKHRITAAEAERLDLRQRIAQARQRLESLLERLPEES